MNGFFCRLVISILVIISCNVTGYCRILKGIILNADDGQPVAYASIVDLGTGIGVLSDSKGRYSLFISEKTDSIAVSALSFETAKIPVDLNLDAKLNVSLTPVGLEIKEVVVKPKKEKYSKRNNPAVDLSRRIAENRKKYNPERNDYYNYCQFHRYSIGINDFDVNSKRNLMFRKFSFLKDYAETCFVTGRPILVLSVREISSSHHYRSAPEKKVNIINRKQQMGIDDFLDEENLRVFLDDILGNVDIYKNDVTLLQNRFVSPFSSIAPDFYKFFITDTVEIDSISHIELSFVPKNSLTFGFTGKMYVEKNDPSTFVRRVNLNVPKDINLNFIDRLYISIDYKRMPDSSSVKSFENIVGEIQLLPGLPKFYAEKHAVYGEHNFEKPSNESLIFNRLGNVIDLTTAEGKDLNLIPYVKYMPAGSKSDRFDGMMSRLRRNKAYYWSEKAMKLAFTGYVNTSDSSKLDIGPLNTFFSHNHVEGYRFKVGGMSTAYLNPHLFGRAYVAWGSHDHRFKYMGEVEYSFKTKRYHSREFPVHSIRACYQYDVDMLGQHFSTSSPDNIVLSIRRHKDYQMTYRKLAELNYNLELPNNFSINFGLSWQRQYSTEYMTFTTPSGFNYRYYDVSNLRFQVRYAPGEKFYQSKTHRYPISLDAPAICLTHEYAPSGVFGNKFCLNKTQLSFQKRFWLSAFGYIDGLIKCGHVWSRTPYPGLLIPNANLSYTIQPESYSLMNAMEFINDSYASLDVTYWANGAIFNYIPVLNRLKLREVFSFKGLWGHLSSRNDPEKNSRLFDFPEICNVTRMSGRPYMEVSAGVENIFKVLRVDYVWRLSYLDNPAVDRHGVRVAVHVTF